MNYNKINKLLREGTFEDILICKELMKKTTYQEALKVFKFNGEHSIPYLRTSSPGNPKYPFTKYPIIVFGNFGIAFYPKQLILIRKYDLHFYERFIYQ